MAKIRESRYIVEFDLKDLLEYFILDLENDCGYFVDRLNDNYGLSIPQPEHPTKIDLVDSLDGLEKSTKTALETVLAGI